MTPEKEMYLEKRLEEISKEWEENPLPPFAPVIDIEREPIPMSYDTPASTFDFTAKEGHTTYEVVGHFNPDARENLLQKIWRMMKEEKSLQ